MYSINNNLNYAIELEISYIIIETQYYLNMNIVTPEGEYVV